MKAAVIHQHGGIDNLCLQDVNEPELAADEVIIKTRAAALNHLDIWVRKGRPGLELPDPHILGSDATGIVIEKGADVRDVQLGDEVVVNPGLSCGFCEFCARGEQSECRSFGIIGMNCPGTFAERISVPAKNVLRKPPHLTDPEAAALTLAHMTAWRMLMTRGQLKPGETILIHGIGGGVALAGLQLAKLAGARVIVTSSSDGKLARAREFGANECVNYTTNPSVADAVKDMTGGLGVDLILDATGAATWKTNFEAIRRGGRIVHCGVTTGASALVNISTLYWNHLTVMGSTMGSHSDFRQMLDAVTVARLKPVIDSAYPLSQIRDATERMEQGLQFGKIVIVPGAVEQQSEIERAMEEPFAHISPEPIETTV